MRKFLCLCLLGAVTRVWAYEPVKGVFVADADTGKVIYSYNADKQTQPASLTKMMTLLLTFRALRTSRLKWTTPLSVSAHAAAQSPSKLGLKAGARIMVRDAVMALITKSANDMAVVLAEQIGGTEANFVRMMNMEAVRLRMHSTNFVNPSGWKNAQQRTTARDMFKLSQALYRNYRRYYHLFATKSYNFDNTTLRNHNRLLGKHPGLGSRKYFEVDGIKTGYVAASGFNLAASATDGKIRLIAVVLGGKTQRQRDQHVHLLFQKGFPRAEAQLAKLSPKSKRVKHLAFVNSKDAYLREVGVFQPAVRIQQAKNVTVKRASISPKSTPSVIAPKTTSKTISELVRQMNDKSMRTN